MWQIKQISNSYNTIILPNLNSQSLDRSQTSNNKQMKSSILRQTQQLKYIVLGQNNHDRNNFIQALNSQLKQSMVAEHCEVNRVIKLKKNPKQQVNAIMIDMPLEQAHNINKYWKQCTGVIILLKYEEIRQLQNLQSEFEISQTLKLFIKNYCLILKQRLSAFNKGKLTSTQFKESQFGQKGLDESQRIMNGYEKSEKANNKLKFESMTNTNCKTIIKTQKDQKEPVLILTSYFERTVNNPDESHLVKNIIPIIYQNIFELDQSEKNYQLNEGLVIDKTYDWVINGYNRQQNKQLIRSQLKAIDFNIQASSIYKQDDSNKSEIIVENQKTNSKLERQISHKPSKKQNPYKDQKSCCKCMIY